MNREKLLKHMKYTIHTVNDISNGGPHGTFTRPVPFIIRAPEDAYVYQYMVKSKAEMVCKKDFKVFGITNVKNKKYVVVIPHHNRVDNCISTIDSFSNMKHIGIVVVDMTNIPNPMLEKKIKSTKNCYITVQDTNSIFNKSEMMNIAYSVLSKSDIDWFVFHDTDVVLSSNFEEAFLERVSKSDAPLFFQCFAEKRVAYLGSESSSELKNYLNENSGFSVEFAQRILTNPDVLILGQGAPGGSIAVHRSLFEVVGGYDSDWYIGYGPEDASFFSKCVRHYTKHNLDPKWSVHQIQNYNLESVLGLHLDHVSPVIEEKEYIIGSVIHPCLIRLTNRTYQKIITASQQKLWKFKEVYSQ